MLTVLLGLLTLLGAAQAQLNSHYCLDGRNPIVHLFEWKWTDVANECSRLADAGYCAIQVSPPQEHAIITEPNWRPWWERYQAVGYNLYSRSGSHQDFINMVETCNNLGIWIYVDAIINHMTGSGSGIGSGGSYWDAGGDNQDDWGGQDYPAYDESHFNPPDGESGGGCIDSCSEWSMNVENYQDIDQVRKCRLLGLRDLRLCSDYVRDKLVDYLNSMIDIGVAGFRVDACKHMWPGHLQAIYDRLNDLTQRWFAPGTRPYVFQEVTYVEDEPVQPEDYVHLGRVTEFRYGAELSRVFLDGQISQLQLFGEAWGFLNSLDALVFVDNHDNQRGHWSDDEILTHKTPELYKMAVAYMLAWDYGHPRVMSSYQFDDTEAGPPSDGDGNTHDVVCQSSGGSWVCEHRWRQIANMVRFHNVALGADVTNWWDNDDTAISFSRGDRAFIAINNQNYQIQRTFSTGMPAGEYCNVILCDGNRPPCSGEFGCGSVTVQSNGDAFISVPSNSDSMVAIHV